MASYTNPYSAYTINDQVYVSYGTTSSGTIQANYLPAPIASAVKIQMNEVAEHVVDQHCEINEHLSRDAIVGMIAEALEEYDGVVFDIVAQKQVALVKLIQEQSKALALMTEYYNSLHKIVEELGDRVEKTETCIDYNADVVSQIQEHNDDLEIKIDSHVHQYVTGSNQTSLPI